MSKKHRKRPVKVEITKTEGTNNNLRYKEVNKLAKSLNSKNNNKNEEYFYYAHVPYASEEGTLDNVSFSNKNVDTNNLYKNRPKKYIDKIDPNILKQFKLISELENNKLIKKLEKEKEML